MSRVGRAGALRALMGLALLSSFTASAAVLVAGCDPYDPQLGERPFRCGALEPRCPDGYACVALSSGQQYCYRDGAVPDAGVVVPPDTPPFVCAGDATIEPNDRVVTATPTAIPDGTDSFERAGLAICPTVDIDLFELAVTDPGRSIVAEIEFLAVYGSLALDVINPAGGVVATGAVVAGAPGRLRVAIVDAPLALYYVRVRAAVPGIENNYDLRVTVPSAGGDATASPER